LIILFKNMEYNNYPQKKKKQEYVIAKDEFIKFYSHIKEVKSIYSFGSVSMPGISDLDLLIIIDDAMDKKVKLKSYLDFSKSSSYILSHNPFIFPASQVKSINKIFNFKNLKHEYGPKIIIDQNKQEDNLFILIDLCNYFYPRIFLTFLHEHSIDIRLNIQLLNAFRHSVLMAYDLFIISKQQKELFDRFFNELDKFKIEFFKNTKNVNISKLKYLNNKAVLKSFTLVKYIDKYIKLNYWQDTLNKNNIVALYKKSGYIFIKDYDQYPVVKIMISLYNKFGGWISILPDSFLYPLIKYSHVRGLISNLIKNNLILYSVKFLTFKNIENALTTRSKILNNHYKFYKDKININPVHDYYQMSGRNIKDSEIKKICKMI